MGRGAVFLDNYNAKELRSDTLASALTENPCMVRVMGQTKNVPLHARAFIGITGNGIDIAEDMARRIVKTKLDAQMENPEQRGFAPGFLKYVLASRASLLSDALTIWRWGRHTRLAPGRPLGSYEVWTQWCRDPLLMLGMRDPVDRIAEIKAADPRRSTLVAVFDVWSAFHGNAAIKAADLAEEVIEQIDPKASRNKDGTLKFSRQRVAGFLNRNAAGTRVGGYRLEKIDDPDVLSSKPVARYQLH